MSDELQTLFEAERLTHNRDPYTSREAALKSLRNAKGMNRAILDELAKVYPDGLTDELLAARLHVDSTVSGNNVAKRRSALTQKGLVVACKHKDLNRAGNKVTVWKLYFPPSDNIQPRQYEPQEKAKHYDY